MTTVDHDNIYNELVNHKPEKNRNTLIGLRKASLYHSTQPPSKDRVNANMIIKAVKRRSIVTESTLDELEDKILDLEVSDRIKVTPTGADINVDMWFPTVAKMRRGKKGFK